MAGELMIFNIGFFFDIKKKVNPHTHTHMQVFASLLLCACVHNWRVSSCCFSCFTFWRLDFDFDFVLCVLTIVAQVHGKEAHKQAEDQQFCLPIHFGEGHGHGYEKRSICEISVCDGLRPRQPAKSVLPSEERFTETGYYQLLHNCRRRLAPVLLTTN